MKIILFLSVTALCLAVAGCSCGETAETHTHKYVETVTAPTCLKEGYTTFTCECGKSYKDNFVEPLGHDFEGDICTRCGYERHDHVYELTVVKPDCTNGGYTRGVCAICGATYTTDISAPLGHDYDNGFCTRCGDFDADKHVHVYTETVTEPNCTERGYTTFTCGCGYVYTGNFTDPCHDYVNGVCTRCGNLKGTEGLEYTLSQDGSYYICSGTGTVTDREIVIAADYNGKPVKAVADLAFAYSYLTDVTIPDGILLVGRYSFGNFRGENISIPDSVISIGDFAFIGSSMKSISIGKGVVAIGDGIFGECTSLQEIFISEENKTFYCRGNCIIEAQSKTLVAGIGSSVIPDDGSVTAIGNYSFYYTGLTVVNIPYGVTSIGNYAFFDCFSVTEITLPESLISIGSGAFSFCNITTVHIPARVSDIGNGAFRNCNNLESITVDEKNTSYTCRSGCLVDIKKKTVIFGFGECIIPADGSVTAIGFGAFSHNDYLTSLIIPECVEIIEISAFSSCNNLEQVTISGGVKSIGSGAFTGCVKLTALIIPDSVTYLGGICFTNCSNLESLTIPNSVEYIGGRFIDLCNKLTEINFDGTTEQWNKIEKHEEWGINAVDFVIHCTDGDIEVKNT